MSNWSISQKIYIPLFGGIVIGFILIRLLAKLILQEGKAPKVRRHSAKENPVLR